jgi:transposase
MNREEREEYVIRLYKENRSIREIAKLVHMSFRDIGAITQSKIAISTGKRPSRRG